MAGMLLGRVSRLAAQPGIHGFRWPASPGPRRCVACGDPVLDDDPFLRYRGAYYHAGLCHEQELPALREREAQTRAWVHGEIARPRRVR